MSCEAVYGLPRPVLATVASDSIQVSPLVIGARPIEELAEGSLQRFTMLAPPGTLERRYALALALRALATGGELVALAPKVRGGSRIASEVMAFGCRARQASKAHYRICHAERPATLDGLDAAIRAGGPQWAPRLGLWSQPGVFSWDRIDPGSALLLAQSWDPAGAGVDLGCGAGLLAKSLLASDAVTRLVLIDLDARATAAARRNIDDPRAEFLQHDLRDASDRGFDFAIMNPPFHDGGAEDRSLGGRFVETAAAMLRSGGVLRMVANVALPYEESLAAHFQDVRPLARGDGYKVLEATK